MSDKYPLDRHWNPDGPKSPSYCPVVNIASEGFIKKLETIESGVWGWPCAVTLDDGTSYDTCLAWENKRYSDKGNWLSPHKVNDIHESNSRLPAKFARAINEAGESGMGYHIYVVELVDGASFVHVAGNLVIDLLDLPIGYTSRDVVNVVPHAGHERSRDEGYRQVREYMSLEFIRP